MVTIASDNPFPSVLLVEGDPEALADDAAAGQRRLAVGTDHLLYLVDDAGVKTAVANATGAVATDAVWDAAGDLVQGTGANTAAKLSAGAAGKVLTAHGTAAALTWETPAAALVTGRVTRTAGDLTTTSTTFVDATGMSITVTTGARSVLICVSAVTEVNAAATDTCLDIDVDGSRLGGAFGIATDQGDATANRRRNLSFSTSTAALSAGSHTFKLQWRTAGGTATLYAGTNVPLTMTVVELPA